MSDLTQREKELGYCEEARTYCSVAEERYKQGRTDAIEEIESIMNGDNTVSVCIGKIEEWLKENKNDD